MGFGDVRTEIVPKGVVSTLGDGTLRITVPTTFESSVTSTHLSGAQLPIILSPVNLTGSFTLSSPSNIQHLSFCFGIKPSVDLSAVGKRQRLGLLHQKD